MDREPNTQYILSLSYGKDSLACLAAIEQLGLPLDGIVHSEVWATDTISADLPPMVEFKKKADAIIKERWGIEVEHVCAMAKDGTKQTYEKLFYHVPKRKEPVRKNGDWSGKPKGFPKATGSWCKDIKIKSLDSIADTIGGGQNLDSLREQSMDSPTSERNTAQDNSKPDLRILGFPIVKGNWCTSNLKRRAFLLAPLHRERK